jgi:signal peptidase II
VLALARAYFPEAAASQPRFGAVIDFLDFHWGEWHFPAFNLADSAITVGVGLLVIDGLLSRRESRN